MIFKMVKAISSHQCFLFGLSGSRGRRMNRSGSFETMVIKAIAESGSFASGGLITMFLAAASMEQQAPKENSKKLPSVDGTDGSDGMMEI